MTEDSERHEDVREIVARRIKAVRERRGFSLRELSRRLAELGHSIDASALMRLERAERRPTIDDLLAIAAVLDVSPVSLAMPDGEDDHVLVGNVPVISHQARAWWRGFTPVEGYGVIDEDGQEKERVPGLETDERIFYSEVSDDEWHALRTPGVRELLDECMTLVHTANRVTRGDDYADPGLLAYSFRRLARIAAHHADLIDEQEG